MDIAPFTADHLKPAARLVAIRHRRDRVQQPALPQQFETTSAAHDLLRATLDWPGTHGVVAIQERTVRGFLLGITLVTPHTSRVALFQATRSAFVPLSGYGLDVDAPRDTFNEMYGALARHWVARGYLDHYVQLCATDQDALDAWHGLGFGRDLMLAMRETASPLSANSGSLELRRGTVHDLDVVLRMVLAMYDFHRGSPMFLPYLAEIDADEREFQRQLLEESACAHWLAYRGGQAVGFQCFEPVTPGPISPMIAPDRSVHLINGYTHPDARGEGVGGTLLSQGLAWARAAGYSHCLLHVLEANVLGRRFWLGAGFRPVAYRLHRHIEASVAWDEAQTAPIQENDS